MSTHDDKRARAATRDIPEDEEDGAAAAAVADEEPDGTGTGEATDFSTFINAMAGAWSALATHDNSGSGGGGFPRVDGLLPVGILAAKFFGLATPNRTRWL
ncbi:hypothetical protein JB92DRAFT_2842280 [Gautieria morchelliformis]|nr:hypothetical protein JB92DRAFT_2842280 [Gautieria morchelliformis]